jgi:membrane protease YdiL (CAAX protease family)
LIAGSVLTLWILGMARISEGTGLQGLGGEILRPLVTATGEELLFRVILLAILQEITGSLVAILISAAAFGLAHLGNPGVTPYAIFALSIDGGVMLALAYILTRNMWLAVGVHASWNFTQAFVFGLQDSGLRDPHSFFQTTLSGPALLTGGAFGLEGSLITLGFGVVASAILFELIARRRRWTAVRFELTTLQPRLDPAT